ncbi:MAG: tRNA pseudouridine(55) synthase TruB [Lacipirellulaceae bacterium]
MLPLFGLLNLDKPAGFTSRDAVNRVQRLVRPAKVGHAGTLDPIATGVLVVLIGPATRLTDHVQRQPKRYRATFLLGRTSPSDDTELPAVELVGAPVPTLAAIEAALPRFLGDIQQAPPAYSAIKVGGQKAYDLARKGRPPDLAPRGVTIHTLGVVRYDYPELVLDVSCGSGTYVRALGRDLAVALGTGAVMSALVRTAIGPFTLDAAIDPRTLDEGSLAESMLPATLAVADLEQLVVSDHDVAELRHGRFLDRATSGSAGELAALDERGELIATLTRHEAGKLRPTRVFVS